MDNIIPITKAQKRNATIKSKSSNDLVSTLAGIDEIRTITKKLPDSISSQDFIDLCNKSTIRYLVKIFTQATKT